MMPRAASLRSLFNSSALPANQATPTDRTIFHFHTACASQRSRASKTQPARGSTETRCHFPYENSGVANWEGGGLISR